MNPPTVHGMLSRSSLFRQSPVRNVGPELHQVAIVGNEITIACSPAQAIVLAGPRAHACSLRGDGVTTATFSLEGFIGSYCRVTMIDQQGRRAWSNPIWLDRLDRLDR